MSLYAIYKYFVVRPEQKELFQEPQSFAKEQEAFGKIIEKSLPARRVNKKDEVIFLDCAPECKRGDVAVLMLCNEKSNKYMERKERREFLSHPGCYIIIDNRQDVGLMAIERSSAFDNNTESVRGLMEDAINRALSASELSIEIKPKRREGKFWDIVDEQQHVYKDPIKRVVFEFPNPNRLGPIDTSQEMTERLRSMMYFAQCVNAAKGTLLVDADSKVPNSTLHLDRMQEDLSQMVSLCCNNGYDIAVHFAKYGVYRYGNGKKAQVQCHMEDEVIREFIQGQTYFGDVKAGDFQLLHWLDDARNIPEDLEDETPTPKTRTRRHKSAV